jgi:hypothetical protein
MYKQAVVRLCQGTTDKEAGSYASNIRPKNMALEILVSPPFEDYAQGWFQIWPDYYVGTTSFDQ